MKPNISMILSSRKSRRHTIRLSFALVAVASVSAYGADFTLEATDPSNTSSFTTPLTGSASGWTDGVLVDQAPSAGNDYFTGAFVLRTPTTGDHIFAGDSLTLQSGGQLALKGAGGSTITVNDLILDGGQLAESGASLTGTYHLAGAISVTANGGLIRPYGATGTNSTILNISAAISGTSGTLTLDNGGTNNRGTTRLSSANTFSGTWALTGSPVNATNGALQLNHFDAVKFATVNVASTHASNPGLTFSAGAGTYNIGALTGVVATGRVLANSGVILSVGDNDASTSFAGVVAGDGALTKTGSGTLTLDGANIYTGATTINEGSLALGTSGSLASSNIIVGASTTFDVSGQAGGFTLAGAQTLSGPGTVTGAMSVAGTLNPGSSPGSMTTGSQTWLDGGDYNWQILDATGAAGTGYDTIAVTGTLNLASLTTGNFGLNLWSLSSISPDVSGDSLNFNNLLTQSWTILTTTGGISGFDATDFLISVGANNGTGGFSNALAGGSFSLGQTGNNLVLTYTAVPEPAAALLSGLGLLTLLRRRRA